MGTLHIDKNSVTNAPIQIHGLQPHPPKTKSLTRQAIQPICDRTISLLKWCSIPPTFSRNSDGRKGATLQPIANRINEVCGRVG
jgi:hypothetical protein